jgi:hypothetical protein
MTRYGLHNRVQPAGHIHLPVRFDLENIQFREVHAVQGWLVAVSGFPWNWKRSDPGSVDATPMHARWLESCLQLRNKNSSENARRFLLKYGQFRYGYLTRSMKAHEWHPLVPAHVKKDLIALITPGEYWEMLLESDFWDEWKLLELFAEISSQLFFGANPIRFSA